MRHNYRHAGPRPLPFARFREIALGVGVALALCAATLVTAVALV